MSKRKNRQPAAKPAPCCTTLQKASTANTHARKTCHHFGPGLPRAHCAGGVDGGCVGVLAYAYPITPPSAITASTPTPQRRTNIGRTTACQRNPNFSESVGLGKQVVASTANGNRKGLLMFSPNAPDKVLPTPHLGQRRQPGPVCGGWRRQHLCRASDGDQRLAAAAGIADHAV